MKTRHIVIAAAALLIGAPAFADTQCADTATTTWMAQSDLLRKLADTGYTIERFKVTRGNCYEMKGWDKDGKRVEIYFNPIDGKVVKMKAWMAPV